MQKCTLAYSSRTRILWTACSGPNNSFSLTLRTFRPSLSLVDYCNAATIDLDCRSFARMSDYRIHKGKPKVIFRGRKKSTYHLRLALKTFSEYRSPRQIFCRLQERTALVSIGRGEEGVKLFILASNQRNFRDRRATT